MDDKQIILQAKYARIIKGIAKKLHLPLEKAMDDFYHSQTFQMINDGVADLHCRSDIYLINEYCLEIQERKNNMQQKTQKYSSAK